ncbi:MAG: methyl-accepting chemotaxis protein, partial [Coleofasciculaceae cyanobacterium SM2_3_26]|nr:methyl-accepting chemotaxis protein [Coleofasciculaceae cyanobacterium SM2_3_26]
MPEYRQAIFEGDGLKMLKLATKLYIGFFAIPALILVSIGTYSVFSFYRLDRKIGAIYDDRIVPMLLLKQVSDDYAVNIVDAVNRVNANIWTAEKALNVVESSLADARTIWEQYKGTELTDKEQLLVEETENHLAIANREIDALIAALKRKDKSRIAQFDGALYTSVDPLRETIQENIDLQLSSSQRCAPRLPGILFREIVIFFGILVGLAV